MCSRVIALKNMDCITPRPPTKMLEKTKHSKVRLSEAHLRMSADRMPTKEALSKVELCPKRSGMHSGGDVARASANALQTTDLQPGDQVRAVSTWVIL